MLPRLMITSLTKDRMIYPCKRSGPTRVSPAQKRNLICKNAALFNDLHFNIMLAHFLVL
ncbi:MAG: hypothetical protein JWO20_107 [Candidatus Angelobacter sp.]|nr:hypothetical protein [Candidatus Angelobacter sp.]